MMSDLKKDMKKCGDARITYIPYIPVQVSDKRNPVEIKALEKVAKAETHTKYGSWIEVEKHNKEVMTDYEVMDISSFRELGKQRIDESKDSEWQCPKCKHRIKNLQRLKTRDGSPCWGCGKFCDTVDASYFNGKACKLHEEGDNHGRTWW